MLTADVLRSILFYDPATGEFRWAAKRGNRNDVGKIAGKARPDGYIRIKIAQALYFSHRLAWLHVHGEWPSVEIDHINGNPSDNRISNLRLASSTINKQNVRAPRCNNRSGFLGVALQHGRYRASIRADGAKRILGTFDTAEEASAAYIEAKRKLHVGCTI